MTSARTMLALLVGAAILGANGSVARAEADHAAIARASLTQVIRPGYAALAKQADALRDKIDTLCQTPSAAALEAAKSAFGTTVDAWSKVEFLRFGPVTEDHRHERLFYWPDPKGLGLKQVQAALAKRDAKVTRPGELAAKSVALQGLPTLEYLLYGDDADTLAGVANDAASNGVFRCAFALAVATNIDTIAKSVVEDWRDGAAYAQSFVGPAPDDPHYHAPKEVTLDLFKAFTSGIELVRDQKLGKPLGATAAQARPKLAAFWRSGLTFNNAAGNLDGVRALFAQGGFAQVVAQQSAGVENSILFDLDHPIESLRAIRQSVTEVAADEAARARIEALRVSLKSAAQTAGDMIAQGAGLAFGFNAMDGD